MVGALLCIFSSVLLWTIERREQSNLQNEINSKAVYMASHVNADLRNRITSLKHMAKRCEIPGGMPKEQFTSDARAYLSDFSGLQALEWVDKDFIVRWIVPLKGNELAQNLNLAFEENRRMALEKAKESKSPTLSPPIDLVQGGKGFLAYFPVFVNGEFEGFVLAVFRIEAWMYYVFRMDESRLADDFKIKVFFDDYPVFEDKGWKKLKKYWLTAVSGVKIMDRCFSIHIWPTENYIENGKTLVPKLTGVFCFLLSVLMAYIVFLLQKAHSETRKAHAANKALEVEIREHKVTAEALKKDVTDRKKIEAEREEIINELKKALAEIKTLKGIVPICASCKKIRDDKGYWEQVESYIGRHTDAKFSHGICSECEKKLYAEFFREDTPKP
jgi:sensor domain CHASE-containing protein